MTDKCEYEPVDTGDGKKKVNQKKYIILMIKYLDFIVIVFI